MAILGGFWSNSQRNHAKLKVKNIQRFVKT